MKVDCKLIKKKCFSITSIFMWYWLMRITQKHGSECGHPLVTGSIAIVGCSPSETVLYNLLCLVRTWNFVQIRPTTVSHMGKSYFPKHVQGSSHVRDVWLARNEMRWQPYWIFLLISLDFLDKIESPQVSPSIMGWLHCHQDIWLYHTHSWTWQCLDQAGKLSLRCVCVLARVTRK